MTIDTIKKFKKYSLITFTAYVIIYYAIIFFLPEEMKNIVSDIYSPIGILLSLIVIGWSIKHFERGIHRNIWILCFLGNLSFLLGDLTWIYFEVIKGMEVPYPSIADLYYILTPIFYFIASIIFFKVRGIFISIRAALDILIVLIIATTIECEFVFNQLLNDTLTTTLYKLVSILYPVTDLTLLFVAIFMYFNYHLNIKNIFHSKLLIIAPLIWIVGDQIYIIKSNFGLYMSGNIIDTLWLIGLLLIAIVSVLNVEFNLSAESKPCKYNIDKNANAQNYVGDLLPYICAIILLIINSRYIKWNALLIGGYSAIVLIIARQISTLSYNKKLLNLLSKSNLELKNSKLNLEKVNNQLIQVNSIVEQEARTDFLTNLYNRRFVEESLSSIIDKADKGEVEVLIMILDIDHFKKINDIYGHDIGDLVLKDLALIMKNSGRSCDTLGRWGGEEFILVKCTHLYTKIDIIKQIAERIRINVESHEFLIGDNKFSVTVSIGATKWLANYDDINSAIKRADNALYEAKSTGRNKVVIF